MSHDVCEAMADQLLAPPPPQASWAESLGRVSGSGLAAGAGFGISVNFAGYGISGNFEYMLAIAR